MVELVRVHDFVVEMAVVEGVAGIVDIEMVFEEMVGDMDVDYKVSIGVGNIITEEAWFHNNILAKFV